MALNIFFLVEMQGWLFIGALDLKILNISKIHHGGSLPLCFTVQIINLKNIKRTMNQNGFKNGQGFLVIQKS
jgi:hypothetical protein